MACPSDAAELIASRIPLGRLSTVTTVKLPKFVFSDEADRARFPNIYGVVLQREAVLQVEIESDDDDDDEEASGFVEKGWLLQLAEGEDGALHWQDFVPSCKCCKRKLGPVLDQEGLQKCPVCKGQKGHGKCFQFACPAGSPLAFSCGKMLAKSRPVYCGSHPYFAGYLPADQCSGSFGPPLFQKTRRRLEEAVDFIATARKSLGSSGVVVDLFPTSNSSELPVLNSNLRSIRILVSERQQSLISSRTLPESYDQNVTSAIAAADASRELPPGNFIFRQRSDGNTGTTSIAKCRAADDASVPSWDGEADIDNEGEPSFSEQVVELKELSCFVGLAPRSLWTMDLSAMKPDMSAASLADKLCWRKVMDLPLPHALPSSTTLGGFPQRLLARGHGKGQVVIFSVEGSIVRPWLLVEICDKPVGQSVRTTKLTSTTHVCLTSPDLADADVPSRMLPSVIRIWGRRSGYLFFDQLGQAHLLRDESIILQEEAWMGPELTDEDAMRRVVTFNVQTGAGNSTRRFCLMGMLVRFEYFARLFKGWQEGASAEVSVTDVDVAAFDHFMHYVHCGKIDCGLNLWMLVRLMGLGNKYILSDFLARCLVLTARILDDPKQMEKQEITVLAELLAFADDAAVTCPTLKTKIMDSILCFRGDALKDPQFLSRIAAKNPDVLAALISPVAPKGELENIRLAPEREKRGQKRKKLEQDAWLKNACPPPWSRREASVPVNEVSA